MRRESRVKRESKTLKEVAVEILVRVPKGGDSREYRVIEALLLKMLSLADLEAEDVPVFQGVNETDTVIHITGEGLEKIRQFLLSLPDSYLYDLS